MPHALRLLLVASVLTLSAYFLLVRTPSSPPSVSVLAKRAVAILSTTAPKHHPDKQIHDDWLKSSKRSPPNSHFASPPEIQIDSALPSLNDLHADSPLKQAWLETISSLETAAKQQLDAYIDKHKILLPPEGAIPGTPIRNATEARALQAYLDCTSSNGSWIYDEYGDQLYKDASTLPVHKQEATFSSCDKRFYKASTPDPHEWNVRQSLKWRWVPSSACQGTLKKPLAPLSVTSLRTTPRKGALCDVIRGKNLFLLGEAATTFLLHDLILDWTTDTQTTCYGDLSCSLHAICPSSIPLTGQEWIHDSQVHVSLPHAPGGIANIGSAGREHSAPAPVDAALLAKSPKPDNLHTTLRYRRSDNLWVGGQKDKHVSPEFIHPATGIRGINFFVKPDIRKSDIIIASKAPLPLPEKDSAFGQVTKLLQQDEWEGETKAIQVIKAVRKLTEEVWLPEVLEALHEFSQVDSRSRQLIVWRSNWRIQPDCANGAISSDESADWASIWKSPGDGLPPHLSAPSLRTLLFGPKSTPPKFIDPNEPLTTIHALFYNLQVVLQNHLLRKVLLPPQGILYLDLESAPSIWRSGLLGSSSLTSSPFSPQKTFLQPLQKDCLRPCLPTPGLALEEFFIGGLTRALTWAWTSTPSRRATWTGKNYKPGFDVSESLMDLRPGNKKAS